MSAATRRHGDVLWFLPTHGDGRYLGTSHGARADRPRLSEPDRPGRRRSRLLRRAAADRAQLRGQLGRGVGTGAPDRAPALPRGGPARPADPRGRRAHGGHARPALGRPAADQRRHRRRPGRAQGRRHLPRPRRALRGDRRVPAHLAGAACRRDGRLPRRAPHRRGRPAVLPAGPAALSAALFRRLVGRGHRGRGRAVRHVPHLGRAAAEVAEKLAQARQAAARTGPTAALRHPPARHRARDRAGGLGRGRPTDQPCRRRQHRRGPEVFARMDSVGQQPHGRAARRPARPARDQPQPLGRRRAGPRRRRHRAGRRPRDGGRADARVHGARHRHASSCRATRISRNATASPSWCFRCCRSRPRTGRPRRQVRNAGPFGEIIANEVLPARQARAAS